MRMASQRGLPEHREPIGEMTAMELGQSIFPVARRAANAERDRSVAPQDDAKRLARKPGNLDARGVAALASGPDRDGAERTARSRRTGTIRLPPCRRRPPWRSAAPHARRGRGHPEVVHDDAGDGQTPVESDLDRDVPSGCDVDVSRLRQEAGDVHAHAPCAGRDLHVVGPRRVMPKASRASERSASTSRPSRRRSGARNCRRPCPATARPPAPGGGS